MASNEADLQGRKSFWSKSNRVNRCSVPVGAIHESPLQLFFLRALHGRGTLRVLDIGREASRPYNKTIVLLTFYEIIKNRGC